MDSTLRRTWAEIDMDALAHNYETLRKRIGENVKFLGVVIPLCLNSTASSILLTAR